MIPLVCFSCGYFIGQHASHYEKEKDKICNNPKLTDDDKQKLLTKLLLNLNLPNYCCKMRVMTSKDIVQDILPIPNNP
jgi:DNA-directed RNA polymerase subunit N (RpoN/RPB10)